MNIKYRTAKLEGECTVLKKAKKKYGSIVAEKLFATIEYIEASASLVDVREYPSFHFHNLKGDKKGLYAIDLGRKLGWRLLVQPLDAIGEPCTTDIVFSTKAIEIIDINVEEVTNHYE